MLTPSDKRLLLGAVIVFMVIVLLTLVTGCQAGDDLRRPDYMELHGLVGRSDGSMDGHLTGNPGNGQQAFYDLDGRSRTLGLTLGWQLTRPEVDAVARLDAYMDRGPSVVTVTDASLLSSLEGLSASVTALEAEMASVAVAMAEASQRPPEPPSAPSPEETVDTTSVVTPFQGLSMEPQDWTRLWAWWAGVILALMAVVRYWTEITGACSSVSKFLRRGKKAKRRRS